MPISSVILDVKAGDEAAVAARLAALEGVEVSSSSRGVVIVTTDTPSIEADRTLTESLREVPGVPAAHVAFCSMEDCLEDETSG